MDFMDKFKVEGFGFFIPTVMSPQNTCMVSCQMKKPERQFFRQIFYCQCRWREYPEKKRRCLLGSMVSYKDSDDPI